MDPTSAVALAVFQLAPQFHKASFHDVHLLELDDSSLLHEEMGIPSNRSYFKAASTLGRFLPFT